MSLKDNEVGVSLRTFTLGLLVIELGDKYITSKTVLKRKPLMSHFKQHVLRTGTHLQIRRYHLSDCSRSW